MTTIAAVTHMVGEFLYERAPLTVINGIESVTVARVEVEEDFIRNTFHWGVTVRLTVPRDKITIAIPDGDIRDLGYHAVAFYMRKLCEDASTMIERAAQPVENTTRQKQ